MPVAEVPAGAGTAGCHRKLKCVCPAYRGQLHWRGRGYGFPSSLSTNGHECSPTTFFVFAPFWPILTRFIASMGSAMVLCGPLVGRRCYGSWIHGLQRGIYVPVRAGTTGFATTRQSRSGGEVRGQFYIPEIKVEEGSAGWQGASVRAIAS